MATSFSGGRSRSTRREPHNYSPKLCFCILVTRNVTKARKPQWGYMWSFFNSFEEPRLLNELGSWITKKTHTSLSPIRRGFAPGFVNYKKGCTRLAAELWFYINRWLCTTTWNILWKYFICYMDIFMPTSYFSYSNSQH
jgi:hypothetical protein